MKAIKIARISSQRKGRLLGSVAEPAACSQLRDLVGKIGVGEHRDGHHHPHLRPEAMTSVRAAEVITGDVEPVGSGWPTVLHSTPTGRMLPAV